MNVVAIADQHGYLPDIPPCDLLLIAGDICPVRNHTLAAQRNFLDGELRRWLDAAPAKHVVATWGNHDLIAQNAPQLVPRNLRWHMLVDQSVTIDGLHVWGSPWQPEFFDWAFNLTEPQLERKWAMIPSDADVLVLHGPPYGYGDLVPAGGRGAAHRTGSPSLLRRIEQVRPRLAVYGHIHEGRGRWVLEGQRPVVLANVTVVDAHYRLAYPPMEFELT